jgi:F-type H+-transporting ATPase subunit c
MDSATIFGVASIVSSALCMAIGSIGPAIGEAKAIAEALRSMAQQPDEAGNISRTLFIGLAMVESIAIYCFVIAVILIFANPFWDHAIGKGR